jgi:hypothetical protein
MMSIGDSINEWIRGLFTEGIIANFLDIYAAIDDKIGTVANAVGKGPADFSADIYGTVERVITAAVMPVAGFIITFVAVYELIQLIIDKNNMHDVDTFMFFKWMFKTYISIYFVTNGMTILNGMFEIASSLINGASGELASISRGAEDTADAIRAALDSSNTGELMMIWIETLIMKLGMTVMTVVILVIVYGRMLEIYLTMSVAPIPIATLGNREWSSMGLNYFKSVFALAMQGFLLIMCLVIYRVLMNPSATSGLLTVTGVDSGNFQMKIIEMAALTVMLVMAMFKSGGLAKSLFGAH